jgi:hypothetical protein
VVELSVWSTTRPISPEDGLQRTLLELLPLSKAFFTSTPRMARMAFLY